MIGLSLGLSLGQRSGGAPAPEPTPEAAAYFAAMDVQPDAARKTLIDELIAGLIDDGVWAKLDWLSLCAAHDEQAGRVNAKNPAQVATAVESPTFTTDRGFQGDGAASYLETGIAQNAGGGNYGLTGALFAHVNADANPATGSPVVGISNSANTRLNPRTGTTLEARVNSGTGLSIALDSRLGFSAADRSSSSLLTLYRDGASVGTNAASVTPANASGTWQFLRSSGAYATSRLAACGFGGSMSDAEHLALFDRIAAYLGAIGGGV